jgi:hypothetical protein
MVRARGHRSWSISRIRPFPPPWRGRVGVPAGQRTSNVHAILRIQAGGTQEARKARAVAGTNLYVAAIMLQTDPEE